MNRVELALRDLIPILDECGRPWALVGGLAVSARAEPRTTRDIDVAIAVDDDGGAEAVVRSMVARGYAVIATVEQTAVKRLATARLRPASRRTSNVIVDLLFASSGIERQIASSATRIEVVPGLRVPVASTALLIATKVLARDDRDRPQDADDLRALLREADSNERRAARRALARITAGGFHRGRDLGVLLSNAMREVRSERRPSGPRSPKRR